MSNRAVLKQLSETLKIRFAVPRAKSVCPTNPSQVCWTRSAKPSSDLDPIKKTIEASAANFFPSKAYAVLGFSNGGTAVASFLRLCKKVEFKIAMTVGSSGSWFSNDPQDLQRCGRKLVAMLGSDYQANQKPARAFVAHLIFLKAPATLVEYKDCHELLYGPLCRLFK